MVERAEQAALVEEAFLVKLEIKEEDEKRREKKHVDDKVALYEDGGDQSLEEGGGAQAKLAERLGLVRTRARRRVKGGREGEGG